MFVSQPQKNSGGGVVAPAQGGGAKAFAVVENGEVIDVVLYDGGSGYLVPPRVYVTKNYKIIKQSKKIDSDIIYIGMSPQIQTGDTLFITTGDSLSSPGGPPIQSISSLLTVTPFDTERFITAIIQKEVKPLIPSSQQSLPINSIIEPYITPLIQDVETNIQIITLRSPVSLDAISNVTINQVNREIVSSIRSFLKVKTAPVYPSIYETGAYLVSDIDIDDTVAFVADTSKFLTAGKLLIEDEIVYYSGKLSDRFYNIIRGYNSTTAKQHLAGSFIRQYRDDVTIIDVGTGAGLPGIPLAILFPKRNFVLLDSLGKRITFLRQVVFQLKLENVTPVLSRVENYQEKQFDGVLSRAFASLSDMVTWCHHLVNENGSFYALKGIQPTDEIALLPETIKVKAIYQIKVPTLDAERHVVELIKT